jgi:preprotein translocase subunit SecA
MGFLEKVFGTKNDREMRRLAPVIQRINGLEANIKTWSDAKIQSRIAELKAEVQGALKGFGKPFEDLTRDQVNGVLDGVTEETFAIVREAGNRVLGMRHYDVQLIGGLVLHSGRISEMKTGEGKTLVATLPTVLNALTGQSVHVVTVNDYLASRDADWMGRIYRFLGMSVGVVVARQGDGPKKAAYEADITYGQNNEFGFDYLRDNMKFALRDYKQRGHYFAVVDEVDSILIDEARTPLIISGPAEDNSAFFVRANAVVPRLRKDEHYTVDEKSRSVLLTEIGVTKVEELLAIENLYDPTNIDLLHHVSQSLKAHTIYRRDTDYVIEKGEVLIVDEHTGRLMHGRRWSDGLHGAIEAKENVKIQPETQTLATISFQNYFRLYKKLSGMTGTADTEAEEFAKIYDLDVIVIPTNRVIQRKDDNDLVYKSEREKFEAIAEDIAEYHENGNPILVGTTSVEKSEIVSNLLKKKQIPHQVLNAKRHRDEAGIVAQAGRLGAVTIATNMAGRGTDILLGGNPEHMARTEVAVSMGGEPTDTQVEEYGFLSGRPDLISVERLAESDKKNAKWVRQWEDKLEIMKNDAEERGEEFVIPDDMPKTADEVREQVYAERLAFYKKAIGLYGAALEKHEAQCAEEKKQVKEKGGLRIVGTERHESRRIDNQLRGRAGRQGDPGSSRFYLSLQDDLMRIFATDRMVRVMEALGMEDGVPIEHKMVTSSIANAQKRVEGMHFDSRKNLLEYDDVMNQQRKSVYALRRRILEADPSRTLREGEAKLTADAIRELILDLVEECIVFLTTQYCPEKTNPSEWKVTQLERDLFELLGVTADLASVRTDRDALMDRAFAEMHTFLKKKEETYTSDIMGQLSAFLYLQTIDARWKEHLQHMDHLREGIHMRAYGQKDPKQEYKKEGYRLFVGMRARVRDEVLEKVYKAQISLRADESAEELERMRKERRRRGAKAVERLTTAAPSNGGAKPAAPSGAPPPAPRAPLPSRPQEAPQAGGAPAPTGLPRRPAQSAPEPPNRAQRRKAEAQTKKKVKLK